MNRSSSTKILQTIFTTVLLALGTAGNTAAWATAPEWAQGRILVGPVPGLGADRLDSILSRVGGQARGHVGVLDTRVVEVPPGAEERVIAALKHNPNIEFAEKDSLLRPATTVPNDPYWSDQFFWHLDHIDAPVAWDRSTGAGIVIAVCDSGVDAAHPDLIGKLVPGWNVVSDDDDTSPIHPHGTWVAGVAGAASDNAEGVASIAWDAAIMPVRVTNFTDGGAYVSDIAAGITWAANHGARIVNASYYGLWGSQTITEAANYLRGAGGLLFVSAGNYAFDPAVQPNPAMIVVSSTDEDDGRSSFSNFGDYVDLAAPGNRIWSTHTTADPDNLYRLVAGTSFSSPLAAGVAALIMAAEPDLSPGQVETILKETAFDPAGDDFHPDYGYGRIDAGAAVLSAVGTPIDTSPPSVGITDPGAGSTVSGQINVTVDAADDTAVALVELYAAGTLVGSDSNAPYAFALDTTGYPDGALTLRAAAFDGNGNGADDTREVVVDNFVPDTTPPSVGITEPVAGSTVKGQIGVAVDAADNDAVDMLRLYANASLVATCGAPSCVFPVDTANYGDGSLQFRAQAIDPSGNSAEAGVLVQVDNRAVDTTPPAIRFVAPADGSAVDKGKVTVTVSASDDNGVASIVLYIDGAPVGSASGTSLVHQWQTRKLAAGSGHTLSAAASDTAGNRAESAIHVTVGGATDTGGGGRGKGGGKPGK